MKLKQIENSDNTLVEELNKYSKILFIPIISMRNHFTNKYDLACDGNINRLISTISLLKINIEISVVLPKNVENIDFVLSQNLHHKLIFIQSPSEKDIFFGINANETRKNENWIDFIIKNLPKYDKIVFEPNIIGKYLTNNTTYLNKLIYWCPVSNTEKIKPSFIQEFDELDKHIASLCPTYVFSEEQKEYLKGKSIFDLSMLKNLGKENLDFINLPIIYLPFRLSDKGYKIEYICKILSKLEEDYDFIVLYSSPNGIELPIQLKNAYKIPSNRSIYTSLLTNKNVCIPFLDNPDEILHMSLFEMINNKTFVIGMKNSIIDFDINLNSIDELSNALISFIDKIKRYL